MKKFGSESLHKQIRFTGLFSAWLTINFENKDGYLTQAFFKSIIVKKAQFVSGPFTNMMFEIIEKQKNKIKILVGNVVTTMLDERNLFYRPI